MKIQSSSAQIAVNDSKTAAYANIDRILSGYGATIRFIEGAVFICRREGDPSLHIVLVPSKKWESDLSIEGLTVLVQLPVAHASINSIAISYKSTLCTFCGKPENDREHDPKSESATHAFTMIPCEPPEEIKPI